MKQVVQRYRTGILEVADVPAPSLAPGTVLVRTAMSVISAGTERHLVEMARKTLLQKARARPDLVRRVVQKAKADGLGEAIRQVRHRLDAPVALGYSAAGTVIAVGQGVTGFDVGDTVACGGANVAVHAELLCVPPRSLAHVPPTVLAERAAFGMVGAIPLHAVRLTHALKGDWVAVIGLGLLGLLSVQILKALGCRVIGIDPVEARRRIAKATGADVVVDGRSVGDAAVTIDHATQGLGVAAAMLMAATPSNQPITLAANVVRRRGRIVAAGLVGLDLPREAFFERELELVVPHGAGSTEDDQAENLNEFVRLVGSGAVDIEPLVTHRFPIADAVKAYEVLSDTTAHAIAIVLDYGDARGGESARRIAVGSASAGRSVGDVVIGLIGGGSFARTTLLPELKRIRGVRLRGVATYTGISARHVAMRYGFEYATTIVDEIIHDPETTCVVIATHHDSHAHFAARGLRAGKHVFVEKPLAMTGDELRDVIDAWKSHQTLLMVGFNRRYSSHTARARAFVTEGAGPSVLHCRINAGALPPDSWVNDPARGGDRIRGEVCHFIDLAQFLTGARCVSVEAMALPPKRAGQPAEDCAVLLKMDDGSVASIVYTASGPRRLGRERVELFRDGRAAVIEDFRTTRLTGVDGVRVHRTWSVDRGHRGEMQALVRCLRGIDATPVAVADYVASTAATLAVVEALATGRPCAVAFDGLIP